MPNTKMAQWEPRAHLTGFTQNRVQKTQSDSSSKGQRGMQVYFLMCEFVKTGASLKADILRLRERNDIMGRAMSAMQKGYPCARGGRAMAPRFLLSGRARQVCAALEPYARVPEANDNQRDFGGSPSRTHDCDCELKKSRFAMPS
jgi:hypothetical protein